MFCNAGRYMEDQDSVLGRLVQAECAHVPVILAAWKAGVGDAEGIVAWDPVKANCFSPLSLSVLWKKLLKNT